MVLNQQSLLKMALIQRAPSRWAKGHVLWNARSFQGRYSAFLKIWPFRGHSTRTLATSDFCEKLAYRFKIGTAMPTAAEVDEWVANSGHHISTCQHSKLTDAFKNPAWDAAFHAAQTSHRTGELLDQIGFKNHFTKELDDA